MMILPTHTTSPLVCCLVFLIFRAATAEASAGFQRRLSCQDDEQDLNLQLDRGLKVLHRADVNFLASDVLDGRKPQTPGWLLAQEYLIDQLEAIGAVGLNSAEPGRDSFKHNFTYSDFAGKKGKGTNILGVLRGDELPDEYVVLSAHYDGQANWCLKKDAETSIACNSASDNAASMAILLGVGRALANRGERPRRSVLFAFWDAEEYGLYGSEAYARAPLFPLENIVTFLNYDIQGANVLPSLRNYSFAVGPESGGMRLQFHLAEALKVEALDIRSASAIFGQDRSDYVGFYNRKVPIIFFTDFPGPCYHTNGDDIENLDFRKLEKEARISFRLTWRLANTNYLPQFEKPCLLPATYDDVKLLNDVTNIATDNDLDLFPNKTQALYVKSILNSVASWWPCLFPFVIACQYQQVQEAVKGLIELLASPDCDGFLDKMRRLGIGSPPDSTNEL